MNINLLNPANPASPLSPLNPANPCSSLNPLNSIIGEEEVPVWLLSVTIGIMIGLAVWLFLEE